MHPKILEYKHYIVMAGLAIGLLLGLGVLPMETEEWGTNIRFLWCGAIAFAAFVYYSLNLQKKIIRKPQVPIHPQNQPKEQPPQDVPQPTPLAHNPPLEPQPKMEVPSVKTISIPRKTPYQIFEEKTAPKKKEKIVEPKPDLSGKS